MEIGGYFYGRINFQQAKPPIIDNIHMGRGGVVVPVRVRGRDRVCECLGQFFVFSLS